VEMQMLGHVNTRVDTVICGGRCQSINSVHNGYLTCCMIEPFESCDSVSSGEVMALNLTYVT